MASLNLSSPCNSYDVGSSALDNRFANRFEQYFGIQSSSPSLSSASACGALAAAAGQGEIPGVIYVSFSPSTLPSSGGNTGVEPGANMGADARGTGATGTGATGTGATTPEASTAPRPQSTDQLELILVTPNHAPIYYRSNVTRRQVVTMAQQLRREVSDPNGLLTSRYLAPAQRLYTWLIEPLEPVLGEAKVSNLVFIMDEGLRTLPLAALHDGEQFLVEDYSVGLMPSLRLTESARIALNPSSQQVLAMGSAQFVDQNPLPAVPLELQLITQQFWRGPQPLLNQDFTRDRLESSLQQSFGIIHLATHAEIQPGNPQNSYIQLVDSRLSLEDLRQLLLGANDSAKDLMVLSACRTAIESEEAELGFAGLAFGAGVNSVLASLWSVSDTGTLALMSGFYSHLQEVNPATGKPRIKADALREAQVAMIGGQVTIKDGLLYLPGVEEGITLPEEVLQAGDIDLSHPYFWSAFTLIGNPW